MKKGKLLPSILMLIMCVAVMGIGVFAISPSTNKIVGSITINASNPEVEITAYINSVKEENKISGTLTSRAGVEIKLYQDQLKFKTANVDNVEDMNKKTIILQIKNNSQKDLGAYFLTGTVSEEGTTLQNIATNKQYSGTMNNQVVNDVVTARFTHYTQIEKNKTSTICCELKLNNFYTSEVVVPLTATLNIEEYDPSLAIVSDGTAWLTGTIAPTNSQGETYDFYLNTQTLDIYQKEETGWVLIANIKGEKGDKPTVEINDLGFWVIDGQTTNIKADCGIDELREQLNGLFDFYALEFEMSYESYDIFEETWAFTTSTFSGWGGSIGKPQSFNTISFKTRARADAITKIKVWLLEESYEGTMLFEEELSVNILPYEVGEIIWKMPSAVANTKNINYYFAYACNTLCDLFKSTGGMSVIPEAENQVNMLYFTNGDLSSFSKYTRTSFKEFYYVQVGTCVSTYKIKEDVLKEQLDDLNAIYMDNSKICLPETIYGYANQTMQIYFENIMAYSVNDVLIRVTSSNKGNQYKDRWEYTPTSAETFNLVISIYSKNYNLLQEQAFSVVIKDSTTTASTKVLVIGDSTVEAGKETSKMVELSNADESFDITLLGTMGGGVNLHEGRGGWKATTYVNQQSIYNSYYEKDIVNSFYNPSTSTFDFSYYMTQQSYDVVDVVFLQLGINDIFGAKTETALNTAIETFTTNLNIMIESIRAYNAEIKVVINLIIPCQLDQDKFTLAYGMSQTSWGFKKNMYFANLALIEKYATSEGIYLSWYNAAIDAYTNQGNDVHPQDAGYYQLGTQMYYMLKAIS